MFAYEQHGVVPDILTLSKHFGGGVSISATITSEEIERVVVERGLVIGHSHTNDPMSCVAGIASIDLIIDDDVDLAKSDLDTGYKTDLKKIAMSIVTKQARFNKVYSKIENR